MPISVDQVLKTEFTRLFRNGKKLHAIKWLIEKSELNLSHGKALAMHFQLTPGSCHRCGQDMERAEISTCTHCASLNIDW